jgi:hypothetical protein
MANINDFANKNTKFTGTKGVTTPKGTTGQRVGSESGEFRFNSTTGLMEYYTGTEWKAIDAPPAITNFSVNGASPVVSTFLSSSSGITTIAINGSLFDTISASVLFVGTGGGDVSPLTTTRNNSSLITITVNSNSFSNTFEPYDIKITNGSGLSAILENCIVSDTSPSFTTAAGSLGSITDGTRSSYTLSSAAATDADGDAITYSITSGSLPTGLSFNASTAAITGTASAVVSNTTSTFTVAAATSTATATRQFTITVLAPVVVEYTSAGTYSFTAPAGLTRIGNLKMIGGGGGGTSGNGDWGRGGGGGAGIDANLIAVTPGTTYTLVVGSGGPGGTGCPSSGTAGGPTTAFSNTAAGGAQGAGGAGGTYTLSNGTNVASGNGTGGGQSGGDGQSFGGNNGLGGTYGTGAPGVPNYTPGPNASGYGNGGAGGPSCQNGHRGGGNGSGGYMRFNY